MLSPLSPRIAVSVCRGGAIEVAGQGVGGVTDCQADFGATALRSTKRLEIEVTNPSSVALAIQEVRLAAGSDPAFFLVEAPSELAAGASATVVVTLTPQVESAVRGRLVLTSDAGNAPEGIEIELVGTGVDFGDAVLVVSPEQCAFGRKSPGTIAVCEIVLESRGGDTLLEGAAIDGPGVFALEGGFPTQIGAGTATTARVTFSPAAVASHTGALRFVANGLPVEVPLSGEGADGPSCDVVIASVNGVATSGAAPPLEPLDDVVFALSTSDPDAPTQWTFLERPAGSTVDFAQPTATSTGLVFDGFRSGIDVAGTYRVRATQTDPATGAAGTCELGFSAVPNDELLVQLTWDTPFADIDLHVIQADAGDRYCARGVEPGPLAEDCGPTVINDCYYWSCKPFNSLRPDWDHDGSHDSVGDPSLDVDDLCGYGPENTNIDVPASGAYLIAVDHFGFTGCPGTGTSLATVRVYAYGQVVAEMTRDMALGEWWEVALVRWPGAVGNVCVDDLTTPTDECQ